MVDVEFTLMPDGSVDSAHVIQETPPGFGFAEAAMDVFPRWKFEPHIVDGKPVAVLAYYRITLRLRGPASVSAGAGS